MAKDLVVNSRLRVPSQELRFSFARSGGPGGQNVNKVSSKAFLRWNVADSLALPEPMRLRFLARYRNRISQEGELLLASERYRDQSRNVADCLAKLREMLLAVASPPRRRIKTKTPAAAKEARLQVKRQVAEKKSRRRPPQTSD